MLRFPKRVSRKTAMAALVATASFCLLGIVLSRALIFFPEDEAPAVALAESEKPNEKASAKAEPMKVLPTYPIRVSIPSADIDAKIEYVGITRKGNISAPKRFSQAGWYRYGPVPGEPGVAVIDGHVDNGLALPAVFYDLKNVGIGDEILVERVDGKELKFVVQSIDTYDYDAPTKYILNGSGSILKLITCTGDWIQEKRTHDKRLVVTATL